MNPVSGKTSWQGSVTARSLIRGIGRVAIWATLALLLLRGLFAGPSGGEVGTTLRTGSHPLSPKSAAFAIRFARTYLADPTPQALAPFLAEGTQIGTGRPPAAGLVAQAVVGDIEDLGDGEALVTVACELRDARTLYLAVPIARSDAGEVAALGAPSIVAAPGPAGVAPERLQPVAGRDAAEIQALVEEFLPTYISAGDAAELAYFVAPGKEVQPLGGALAVDGIAGVHQLGPGEGRRRTIVAGARLSDPATGGTYPVSYRLDLTKGARWYVQAVEGAVA